MKLSPLATIAILGLLYVVSVGLRMVETGPVSPYFKGASAMNHRHAVAVADGMSLDQPDRKANWPVGYRPDAYRASGVEEFAGWSYRAARFFSEIDARPFSSRLVILVFSLCVFTLYGLTRRLWDCQAAGLIAAAMPMLLSPLIDATDGRQFSHAPFAITLITVHALLLLSSHRRRSPWRGIVAALVSFAVIASWELGLYYTALATALLAVVPASPDRSRRWVVAAHALAGVAACASLPYLRELRAAVSWPALLLVVTAIACFFETPLRLATRARRTIAIAAATLALTVLLAPIRAGAAASVPALEYVWYRIRFFMEKPASASRVPDAIRGLWSFEHAPPSRHQLLAMFLPLAFLAAATLAGARDHLRRHPVAFPFAAIVAALAGVAYALDRSALVPAAVAMTPFLALSGRGLSTALATRAPLIALGGLIMVTQILFPLGAANPVFQIARGGGFAHQDPHRFLWVSMENTDRQLVGFVATRTSVRDAFLGSTQVTPLLLTFTGRTSVPLAGAVQSAHAARNAEMARLLYEDEASLYDACRDLEIRYVLYSIDYLLDTTRYSPAYLAGVPEIARDSAAFRMHFAPESLRHFTLVYENEHYRLFRVTEEQETVFLTDHPPVYQLDAFERVGGSVEAFRQRVLELVLAYRQAMQSRAQGNTERALQQLNWCLQQAPGFTLARVGVGVTLIRAERFEEARDVLLSVIGYAPDNTAALYHASYVLAVLGETARAQEYLTVLFATATDPDFIERARLLKTFIDQGIPVTPRALPE